MVKLIGVVDDDKVTVNTNNGGDKTCPSRRQIPLVIDEHLTMIVKLDDNCVACCQPDTDIRGSKAIESARDPHLEAFLKAYRSLSKDELGDVSVTKKKMTNTLSSLVNCVGCRRSVETMFNTLVSPSHDTALGPLEFSSDGVVSINKDHIRKETSLANLFKVTKKQLSEGCEGVQPKGGKKQSRGAGRCSLHGLEAKKLLTIDNWEETWSCMAEQCREAALQLPFTSIRLTLDKYLKKHKFCSDCKQMVNKAYNLFVDFGQEPLKAAGEKCSLADPTVNRDGTPNLYCGVTACEDNHVHIRVCAGFVAELFKLVEIDLTGLATERHAKNIEVAQKEVMTCIGLALFERFQNIQQKIKEAEQTCDLLFAALLKTLRTYLDVAAEKKRGFSELDLLCEELEREDRKKEGKRERKRNQRAKKKESKNAAISKIIDIAIEEKDDKICSICFDGGSIISGDSGVASLENIKSQDDDKEEEEYKCTSCTTNINNMITKPGLSLEEMLFDEEYQEDEGLYIPEEDIKKFHAIKDVYNQRMKLRESLKIKFTQMCIKATQMK